MRNWSCEDLDVLEYERKEQEKAHWKESVDMNQYCIRFICD